MDICQMHALPSATASIQHSTHTDQVMTFPWTDERRCCSFSKLIYPHRNSIQMNTFAEEVIEKYEEKEKQFDKRLQQL